MSVAQGATPPYVGRSIEAVLEELRAEGMALAWSSRLVTPELRVVAEPGSEDALDIAREILAAHGLMLREDEGVYLVVRVPASAAPATGGEPQSAVTEPRIENITVSASRYEVSRDISPSNFVLDQQTIQVMPDVGEDPLRITHRLPGAAASGASARVHFRGGEQSEVGIILNGQRLFDPFHVRDYQNIFSAIDSRAVRGVEVYTGGFPVRFGDRMSGVVLMESISPDEPAHTEIGISVFNTSLLHAGGSGDKRWLFSARRGNLDLVIDSKFGRPSYYDVFSQFEADLTPDMTLSANAFYADDLVTVVLETDPAELEQAESRTRNGQAWLQLQNRWSDALTSDTILSLTSYTNRRVGELNDSEKIVGSVSDIRDVTQVGLQQDWMLRRDDSHLLQWGFSFVNGRATYDYAGQADYFGLQAIYENQGASVTRSVSAAPDGASYSVYFADRRKLSQRTTLEWGLRWDDQTYTGLSSDSQLSPRLSILRRLGERSELRLSWGRYHQSQGIQELQVEDGIDNFWPAQRADHLIAGFRHRFRNDVA
ncbi:MAG: TonB-dependent receptor plug domain-containing protein, partial [Woeseiaceae bacterium]|nr:TonB-dependent receptor plug domain-containing protein [Woeseiaceae bacterium]